MIWAFCIAADTATPRPPQGMVRADSRAAAFAQIGDPDTNLYELPEDVEWPGGNENVWWQDTGTC